MSFGWPCKISNPERIIGLCPRADAGDDFCSNDGELLPASGFGVAFVLCVAGDEDFLSGVEVSDFFSSVLLFCTLDFDVGRDSSDFFVTTLFSYGLKANLLSFGVERWTFSDFSLDAAGDERVFDESEDVFFVFSNGEINGFDDGVSAPIWLHVWANRAKGLFFASNCKEKKPNSYWYFEDINWKAIKIRQLTLIQLTVVGNGDK